MTCQDSHELARAVNGKRSGAGYLIRCLNPAHVDQNPSCFVSDGSDGRMKFHCFSGCDFKDIQYGGELQGLLEPFEPRRNLTKAERRASFQKRREAKRQAAAEVAEDETKRVAKAQAIWRAAQIDQGPIQPYFIARGINEIPPIFRFLRAAWHPQVNAYLPAIVAPVQNVLTGKIQAVHMIFLDESGAHKANLTAPKITRGVMRGGAIQTAKPSGVLALAEGVETALSYMQITGTPTWAVSGTSAHKTFKPPSGVKRIILAADNDAPGITAAKAASKIS